MVKWKFILRRSATARPSPGRASVPRVWLCAGLAAGLLAFGTRSEAVACSELCDAPTRSAASLILAQDDAGDQSEVSPPELEKYVAVYKAMQRNRSLTVARSAARQGLTLEEFRHLENRVQRDDAALQQARDELQAAAKKSSPAPEKTLPPGQR